MTHVRRAALKAARVIAGAVVAAALLVTGWSELFRSSQRSQQVDVRAVGDGGAGNDPTDAGASVAATDIGVASTEPPTTSDTVGPPTTSDTVGPPTTALDPASTVPDSTPRLPDAAPPTTVDPREVTPDDPHPRHRRLRRSRPIR